MIWALLKQIHKNNNLQNFKNKSNLKTSVLIEVTAIQQYIFSSNKLKENIGASYIIERLLENSIEKTLKAIYGKGFNINVWKEGKDIEPNSACEVGYIGGGNTLIFFSDASKAKTFISEFTKCCLVEYPNLQLSIGTKDNFDITSNYDSEFQALLLNLKERKARFIPNTSISKHGITTDCPWSNETAEVFEAKSQKFISTASSAKIKAAETAKNELPNTYECLGKEYTLPEDIEALGQSKEASYIAVVHIDGNGMGKIFSDIDKLAKLRKKSFEVSSKANLAMKQLIEHIINLKKDKKLTDLKLENGNLPIRPILVGGDDVTFICEGRHGVYLAEQFINLFYDEMERKKERNSPDRLMDGACAGVAIVKSHFPFYKAVKLAEELCGEAKKTARDNPGSYISFYYTATTFSGTLEELRKKTHITQSGNLYFGPYKLFDEGNEHSIEKLKKGITYFNKSWPRNKVMKLREIIAAPDSSQTLFSKEIKEIGLNYPGNRDTIWINNRTPFFDQIELLDFYLETLL